MQGRKHKKGSQNGPHFPAVGFFNLNLSKDPGQQPEGNQPVGKKQAGQQQRPQRHLPNGYGDAPDAKQFRVKKLAHGVKINCF